ncbi:MAG: MBL fold metallo-hydrolase [Alphaproteobacteria bacterium]|nr:MAG: MBL fold metallo-hydrolase [Alphaproteobacteria bacterium]
MIRGMLLGPLAAALIGAAPALAQQDLSQVEIKTEKLADGVYALLGAGGNIGLAVGKDATFLVDDQFAPLTPKIQAAIAVLTKRPVDFVVNTHWHFDHVGGNENFGEAGALIVAHDNVRTRLTTTQEIKALGRTVPASPKAALPVVTFSESTTFHINGDTLHVFHVAHAHTDGDAIVHFKNANVIHMGDTFFNGIYPFIDVESGGNVRGMIAAADRVLALADDKTKIIPGHGPIGDRASLAAYRRMLADIAAKVDAAIMAGRDLDAILAAKPTAAYDAEWGGGFVSGERLVEFVYNSLKR